MNAVVQLRNDPLSWRRVLIPVFMRQRYPASCWRILDALCEIQKGRYLTVYGGVESIVEHTGLHPRTVERGLARLVHEGALQLVEQTRGGRFPDEEKPGAPGRANGYQLGPLAYQVEPRSNDRGRTPVKRPRYRGKEPRSNDRGLSGKEPRSNDRPTFVLGTTYRRPQEEGRGMGEGRNHEALPPESFDYCVFCDTHSGLHEHGCPRPKE